MSQSMHYNGTDLSGSTYGLTVLEDSFPLMGQPQTDVQGIAQWYGGVSRCPGFGPLVIPVSCVVTGSSASDLMAKLDALKYLLNPKNGEKTLRFDWLSARYWYAVLSNPGALSAVGVTWKRFDLVFVAGDSRAYSTTNRTSPDFTINSNPYSMTVESGPTAVAGTAPADCVWVIKNTSGGTVTSLTLNNETTQESMTWVGSLANGNWLRISTATGLVEKSTDSGANWSASMTLSGAFILPTVQGGVANTVTLTGFSAATVTLAYTARYW